MVYWKVEDEQTQLWLAPGTENTTKLKSESFVNPFVLLCCVKFK